jgi:hypothetical protein
LSIGGSNLKDPTSFKALWLTNKQFPQWQSADLFARTFPILRKLICNCSLAESPLTMAATAEKILIAPVQKLYFRNGGQLSPYMTSRKFKLLISCGKQRRKHASDCFNDWWSQWEQRDPISSLFTTIAMSPESKAQAAECLRADKNVFRDARKSLSKIHNYRIRP